jgi:hypothetical protein
MSLVSGICVVELFDALNDNAQEYILMRNNLKELPDQLERGKDIDVLIRWSERDQFFAILDKLGYRYLHHPHFDNVFLYGVKKYEFFQNPENGIIVDVHFDLACRSLNTGEWIPLDQEIQLSAWENRQLIHYGRMSAWMLDSEDLFVVLIVRSVFDKKEFRIEYTAEIRRLLPLIQRNQVLEKLYLVFFKFAPLLLHIVEVGDFHHIVTTYMTYSDY